MDMRPSRAAAALAITLAAFVLPAAQAAKISMESASGAAVTGMLPQSLAPAWSKAGVDIELALGQTLTKSLLKMGQGTLDASVIPLPAYVSLVEGSGPYSQMGDKAAGLAGNVRSLFAFVASTYHPIVWADSGIEKWSDIKGKRVYIGPPAGAANAQITGLIKQASGLVEGKDYTGIKAPWNVATDNFKDGQYDLYVGALGIGSQAMVELSLSRKIRLLPMPDRSAPPPKLGLKVATVPAKAYPGLVNTEDTIAWSTLMMLAVNKDVPDEVAYQLTKVYFEQLPSIKSSNAAMAHLSAEDTLDGLVAPLHPGALRYYKEAGIAVPAALVAQ
jgi:TRAP transporter TAXI family solute receptor